MTFSIKGKSRCCLLEVVFDYAIVDRADCDRCHEYGNQLLRSSSPWKRTKNLAATGEGWYADLSLLAASLLSAPTRSPIGWRPYCDQNMDTSYRIRKDISYMLQSGHKLQLLVLDEKRQMILFFVINFSFLHKNRAFLQSQKRMNPNCRQCKFRTLLHCLSVSSILRWSARQLANGDAENLW